ncbi:hypothetical protein SteCoe_2447 [Stentor coeruleus]|uniref:PA domain-containing protein n=1 Tax=Stentor coeruleus TaxID=5963 RepID=A0A1R2CZH2_9CILI|nr:hypothetical protein SteCoe_2447 [Stentor coeruleus]
MIFRLTALFSIFIKVFSQSSGSFRILSPDKLNNGYLNTTIATFGNPSYMPRYGHIMIQNLNKACIPDEIFDNKTFVATSFMKYCDPKILAYSFQEAGAAGVVFFLSDSTWDHLQIESSQNDTINIPVLGIDRIYSQIFESVTESPVWVMYQYPLNIHKDKSINLDIYFTHNYTTDLYFIKEYLNINIVGLYTISYKFEYLNETHQLINSVEKDCKKKSNQKTFYCLPSIGNVTGEERIVNALYLSALRDEVEKTNDYFQMVVSILDICEIDYTEECMKKAIKNVLGKSISPDSINKDYWESQKNLFPKYQVNSQEIFWPQYLQEAVFLSRKEQQANPRKCKGECYFSYLFDENAHCSRCNNSECGYNNMRCLQAESQLSETCYVFMLGDGTCNEPCLNDPDCKISITLDASNQIIYYIFIPVIASVSIYWIIVTLIVCKKKNRMINKRSESNQAFNDIETPNEYPLKYYLDLNRNLDRQCKNCDHRIDTEQLVKEENNRFYHSCCIDQVPRTPEIILDISEENPICREVSRDITSPV